MLHPATVQPGTLELLKGLQALPELSAFALAGGTSLALRFGHRLSVDLDLFTDKSFDTTVVFEAILAQFPATLKLDEARNSLSLVCAGVKVDLLAHQYVLLAPITLVDDLRLVSLEDVMAMKLGALSGRGAKKDFWDVAAALEFYSLAQQLHYFSAKYPNSDAGYVVRSLTNFEDAEAQEDPVDLKGVSWELVKTRVSAAVKDLLTGN